MLIPNKKINASPTNGYRTVMPLCCKTCKTFLLHWFIALDSKKHCQQLSRPIILRVKETISVKCFVFIKVQAVTHNI